MRAPIPRAQPEWYSKQQRGGTDAEVLALALLIVRWNDGVSDSAVRTWCDAVVKDSPTYADGLPWHSPGSWREERRTVPGASCSRSRCTTGPAS